MTILLRSPEPQASMTIINSGQQYIPATITHSYSGMKVYLNVSAETIISSLIDISSGMVDGPKDTLLTVSAL